MKSLASSAITKRPKLLPFGNLARPLPDYFESYSGQTAQAASHIQKGARSGPAASKGVSECTVSFISLGTSSKIATSPAAPLRELNGLGFSTVGQSWLESFRKSACRSVDFARPTYRFTRPRLPQVA